MVSSKHCTAGAEDPPPVLTETNGSVGVITLNRPRQLNALNDALMDALGAALLAFDADEAIGAILITGGDKAFAAGADIAAMVDWTYMDVYRSDFITRNWETIRRVRKPVLAAVAGYAMGGGCELALSCDIVIAGESARFGLPEVKLLCVALLAHVIRYRVTMARTRAREAARLPVGADGLVPGAGPITLTGSDTHAALLIHGFGDTTQSLHLLAQHLHEGHGWTVRLMLLPGHGRGLVDFDTNGDKAWRTAVHDEYTALRRRHRTVVIVGLSMGGALATIEAAQHPDLPALVLLAPYLTPPASAERLAPLAGVVNLMVPYLKGGNRERSILDPAARARTLGAGVAPPLRIRDLVAVAHDARLAAAAVTAPVRLLHSTTDYRIPTSLAERHATFFTASAHCDQQWVEGGGHVITVDFCRERVFALTAEWLALHAGSPRPASSSVA